MSHWCLLDTDTITWIGRRGREQWQRIHDLGWNTLVVMLVGEQDDHGLYLKCSTVSGQLICRVRIQKPACTTWLEARCSLAHGLRPYTSKSKVSFISPLGKMVTTAEDHQRLEEILGMEATSPSCTLDSSPDADIVVKVDGGSPKKRKVDEMAEHKSKVKCVVCGEPIHGTPVTQDGGSPLHFGCIDPRIGWAHMPSTKRGRDEELGLQRLRSI
jgi:hypothetical protein